MSPLEQSIREYAPNFTEDEIRTLFCVSIMDKTNLLEANIKYDIDFMLEHRCFERLVTVMRWIMAAWLWDHKDDIMPLNESSGSKIS